MTAKIIIGASADETRMGLVENGKLVDFKVRAWDEKGPISAGSHTRAIINAERFLAKCNAKLEG